MRLRITETNYTTKYDWLFKLNDEKAEEYYIMSEVFYKKHHLKSPITKHELDYFDKGIWVTATVKLIDAKNVVVEL